MGYFTYPLVQDFFLKFYSIRFFRVLNAILGEMFYLYPLPPSPCMQLVLRHAVPCSHRWGGAICTSNRPTTAAFHTCRNTSGASICCNPWVFGCEFFPKKSDFSSNLPTQNTSKIPLQTLTASTLPKLQPSAMKTPQSRPSCKKKGGLRQMCGGMHGSPRLFAMEKPPGGFPCSASITERNGANPTFSDSIMTWVFAS